jgi:hypothetical protein
LLIGIPKNSSKGVGFFQIGGGIAGDFPFALFQCYTKIWKCMTPFELFLQISDQQPVMVRILEQFLMKKLLKIRYEKHLSL